MQNGLPKLDARVRSFEDHSGKPTKLLAFADLVIAGSFVIKGLKVMQKAELGEEPFVLFPSEKGKGAAADKWFDLAHPVTAEARTAAIAEVLKKFRAIGAREARDS